jgi:hypothetical protein
MKITIFQVTRPQIEMKLYLHHNLKNLWVNTDQFINIVKKIEKRISEQDVKKLGFLDAGNEEKDFESFTLHSNTHDEFEDVRYKENIIIQNINLDNIHTCAIKIICEVIRKIIFLTDLDLGENYSRTKKIKVQLQKS